MQGFRFAKQLYPKADITVVGFETTDRRDFYDLAIGNVPFGQYQVNDKAYNKLGFSIHNYFFAKALDQVRAGGVVAFVTSRYTMDAKDSTVRRYLAQRAELLGAIRLPNNAFRANAGTDVVSDIIFLQKRDRPLDISPEWTQISQTEDGFAINRYFLDHPEMVLGRPTAENTQYGKQDYTVVPIEGLELADQLHDAVKYIRGTYQEAELPELGEGEAIDTSIPADPNVKNYSYTVVDGTVYYRENSRMVRPDLNATAEARVKGMVELRDCVQQLIDLQMDAATPDSEIHEKQAELNRLYDDFSAKYSLINDRANPPGNRVQLHAIQLASGHALWQHTEEVAHATGRLQDIPGLKPHTAHSLINRLNDRRAGVVGVEGGPSGGSVFLRGQQLLQFGILRSPCGFVLVKGVGKATPAHILRQQMLFLQGSVAVLLFDLFQRGNGLDIAPEFFLWPTCTQAVIHNAEILRRGLLGLFLLRFRLIGPQGLNDHIIGQIVLVARIDRYRLDGIGRLFRFRFCGFLGCNLFRVGHNLLNKGIIVQLLGVHHLTVHNTALGQGLPDSDGVHIVQIVLFDLGVETVLLDELGNPALHLGPGQLCPFGAAGADRKRGFTVAAVKLTGQPCCGVLFPCMVFHVADNGVFTLDFAIPVLDGSVDVCIREGVQQLMELGIGLVDYLPVQALPKLRGIGIKAEQPHVARPQHSATNSSVALDHGIFIVAMTTGVAVCGVLSNGLQDNGLVLLMQLPEGGRCLLSCMTGSLLRFLGKRKSRGCFHILCFVYSLDLLRFGGEEIQL